MKKNRIIIYFVAVALVAAIFSGRLIDLQIVNGEGYYKQTLTSITKRTELKAYRGEVLDRYGRPLITNVMKYVVYIERSFIPEDSYNDSLLAIAKLFREREIPYTDTFMIGYFPYKFLTLEENSQIDSYTFADFLKYYGVKNNGSAPEIMEALSKKFKLQGYGETEKRILIGLRYDMYRNGTSSGNPLMFADGIDIETVTILEENSSKYPGVIVEAETESKYTYPGYASHILGRVGKISSSEYAALKGEGYTINDYIGKDGIQKSFESYLRGINGVKTTYLDSDYNIISTEITEPAKNGNNVVLTIDIELQITVENALADLIADMQQNKSKYPNGDGDADSGAAVVLDVKTGEILAMASHPTYDLTTFTEDYNSLASNSLLPLLNRAIGGTYEPGSTYKLVSAIMALNEDLITSKTIHKCSGRYTYYSDYQPYCYGQLAHGNLNMKSAIRNSCNSYFFDIIRQLGLSTHNRYSAMFGFGQLTGVELMGESRGYYLSKELFDQRGMTPGDQLMVAIGQLNTVTPIQLASYVQMIANGEERLQPHLLKEVIDSGYNNVIHQSGPVALSSFSDLGISKKDIEAVHEGMISAVVDIYRRNQMLGEFKAAAKTGTAEVPGGSPNAIYVTFAPYDDPEIAIAAVIEHGGEGGYLDELVAKTMKQYFSTNGSDSDINTEGSLIK
ncbi:MAG: hypothetical protein IJD95_05795 [Clostridia bacterium]|nr:hypothetical protein [Clostridia bacterium]